MVEVLIRWVLVALSLFVVGPAAGWVAQRAPGAGGADAATMVFSASPIAGAGAVLGATAIAIGWGFATVAIGGAARGERLGGPGRPIDGLVNMSIVLAWSTWHAARLDTLVRSGIDIGAGGVWLLGLEGAVLGVLVGGAALVMLRRLEVGRTDPVGRPIEPERVGAVLGRGSTLIAVGAGSAAALVVGWVTARSPEAGQTFAAAAVGGVAGGVVGRSFGSETPAWAFAVVFPVVGGLAPVVGGMLTPAPLAASAYAGEVMGLLRVMPMDWAAGLALGLPLGLKWAGAAVGKVEHRAENRSA